MEKLTSTEENRMNCKQPIKLSILICSLNSRKDKLNQLLAGLQPQLDRFKDVECIIATDNREMKIGVKRNYLLSLANGEYITFIDDDDLVDANYCALLLTAIEKNPDVIVFDAVRYANGKLDRPVKYGIEYTKDYHDRNFYYRIPNHLMCVKREIALQVPFKEVNFGEDADYARRLLPLLKTQERINETLYTYLYCDK